MKQWYSNSWNYVVEALNTNIYRGLSKEKVDQLRKDKGNNIVSLEKSINVKSIAISILKDYYLIFIIFSIAFFIFLKNNMFALVSGVVLISWIIFKVYLYNLDFKDYKEIEKINQGQTRVLREGKTTIIPISELVIGDIIFIRKGDVVPADARLIESDNIIVKEDFITGDKYESEKYETKVEKANNLSEYKNILFKSSLVLSGEGIAVVIAVGDQCQVSNLIKGYISRNWFSTIDYKIKKSFNVFNIYFIFTFIAISLVTLLFTKDINKIFSIIEKEIFLISINIASLIIIASYFLFTKFLKDKDIIFNKPLSIFKLIEMDTFIIDDESYVCENDIKVSQMYTYGYLIEDVREKFSVDDTVDRLMHGMLLCNNASINIFTGAYKGDNVDIAINKFTEDKILNQEIIFSKNKKVFELPFDGDRKLMTSLYQIEDKYRAYVKGDLESLLKRCTHIMKGGVETDISEEYIGKIRGEAIKLIDAAFEVVAFAYRNFGYQPSKNENIESNLVFIGMVALEKPIRKDALKNMDLTSSLGIRTILFSSENKLLSYGLGRKLKLANYVTDVISDVEIKYMQKDEVERAFDKVNCYSKINNETKCDLIKKTSNDNKVTAFASDKFSDFKAMNTSNILLTSDKCNSSIMKKVCDMIFKENYFSSLLNLIKKSRIVVNNINKFKVYFSTVIFSQGVLIFANIFSNLKFLHSIEWIIYINFVVLLLNSLAILFNEDISSEVLYEKTELDPIAKGKIVSNSWQIIAIMLLIIYLILNFSKHYDEAIFSLIFTFIITLNLRKFISMDIRNINLSKIALSLSMAIQLIATLVTLFYLL